MRIVMLVVLSIFLIFMLVFAIQNRASMDVSLLAWTITLPKAAVIVGTYLLGMVSGYGVLALLRKGLQDVF